MMISLFLSFAISILARAGSGYVCTPQEVCAFLRPVKADDGTTKNLQLNFEYHPAQPGRPTVIIIPGGPGGTSVVQKTNELIGLPSDWGYVATDPRFVGVNALPNEEASFKDAMSASQVAQDIVWIIQVLDLKDYVVYGESYGTVVATIVGAFAPMPGPRAVVLQGVIGQRITTADFMAAFNREWSAFLATQSNRRGQLSAKLKALMESKRVTAEDLTATMQMFVSQRFAPDRHDNLVALMDLLENKPDKFVSTVKTVQRLAGDSDKTLFYKVEMCREIMGEPMLTDGVFDAESFTFKASPIESCAAYTTKDSRVYDSSAWQIRYPIVYVQGTNDPNTPMAQARYHEANQKIAPEKHFIAIKGGGHGPLIQEGAACAPEFWKRLTADRAHLEQAFDACPSP